MRYWRIERDYGHDFVTLDRHPCDPSPAPLIGHDEEGQPIYGQPGAPAYDCDRAQVLELEREGDPEIEDVQPDGSWVFNLDRYKLRLQGLVDGERAHHTAGVTAKSYAHQRKGAEATQVLALSAEALAATNADEQFPWLAAEAEARGEAITATAARVQQAMVQSEQASAVNEARAIVAKAAIAAAITREDADAAAEVDWLDE